MKKVYLLTFASLILLAGCNTTNDSQESAEVDSMPAVETEVTETVEVTETPAVEAETITETNEEKEEWVTYSDSVLNLSFSYPKAWGQVVITKDPVGPKKGYGLGFSEGRGVFLNAGDYGVDADRGLGWLDIFINMEVTPENVASYCDDKENCVMVESENGIEMVKETQTIFDTDPTDVYGFYNPGNLEFPGIALVAPSIEGVDTTADFKALVNSIRLN